MNKQSEWFCLVDMRCKCCDKDACRHCHVSGCDFWMEKVAEELSKVEGMPKIKWVNPDVPVNIFRNQGYFEIE